MGPRTFSRKRWAASDWAMRSVSLTFCTALMTSVKDPDLIAVPGIWRLTSPLAIRTWLGVGVGGRGRG